MITSSGLLQANIIYEIPQSTKSGLLAGQKAPLHGHAAVFFHGCCVLCNETKRLVFIPNCNQTSNERMKTTATYWLLKQRDVRKQATLHTSSRTYLAI